MFTVSSASAVDTSKLHISGYIHSYAKMEDNYQTPLDEAYNVREGANYRENQHFRAKTVLNFMYGEPSDQWFGIAQIAMDANDPDQGNNGGDNANAITWGEDFSYVFAMYRPFEMKGGRPFGVMMGVIPVKATANAAYFNYFLGDIEEDFILYTAAGIVHSPGINLDFHISKDIGFGVAYLNGVEDASEIAALMEPDSSQNYVIWGEAKKWGFGWNGAVQLVSGSGVGEIELDETTPAGNTLFSYDTKSSHTVFNTMLTYKKDFGPISVMPALGYELITGEACAVTASGLPERDINLTNAQVGLKIFTNFCKIPGEFSILYTDTNTEDFKGIGVLSSDAVNAGIETAVATVAPAGTWANSISALAPLGLADAPTIAAAGTSETVAAVSGVDNDLHVEYRFDVTDNVELGLFYYMMNAQTDNTMSAEYIFSQLDGTATNTRLTAITGSEAAADLLLNGVATNYSNALKQTYEWTDMKSYGLFCKISF